jgi:predicted small metal-binding protein
MAKLINCECGYVVRGSDEDDVVKNAEEHINQAHPELVGKMSRDDLLSMAEEA